MSLLEGLMKIVLEVIQGKNEHVKKMKKEYDRKLTNYVSKLSDSQLEKALENCNDSLTRKKLVQEAEKRGLE